MLLSSLPSSGSVLVKGPSGVGKLEYCVDLAKGFLESEESVVFVTVDSPIGRIESVFQQFGLDPGRYLGKTLVFIDCYSAILGEVPDSDPAKSTLHVSSLSNLEQIAMNISKASSWFGLPSKVIFHSVSPLFFHNSTQTLAKFFQILTAQIRAGNGLVVCALHEGVHEESTVKTIEMFVDGVIEMRFNENLRREMRVHHMQGVNLSSHWVSFQVEDAFVMDSDARQLEKRFSEPRGGKGKDLEAELFAS